MRPAPAEARPVGHPRLLTVVLPHTWTLLDLLHRSLLTPASRGWQLEPSSLPGLTFMEHQGSLEQFRKHHTSPSLSSPLGLVSTPVRFWNMKDRIPWQSPHKHPLGVTIGLGGCRGGGGSGLNCSGHLTFAQGLAALEH